MEAILTWQRMKNIWDTYIRISSFVMGFESFVCVCMCVCVCLCVLCVLCVYVSCMYAGRHFKS